MKVYLSCVSLLLSVLFLGACAPQALPLSLANQAQKIPASTLRPSIDKQWYRGNIEGRFLWKKYHLSGLLYLKKMEDESVRFLFQNEMGITFFDFALLPNDSFQVVSVMDKLNKPALLQTLQKDFKILLLRGLDSDLGTVYTSQAYDKVVQYLYQQAAVNYGIKNDEIVYIENAVQHKKVLSQYLSPSATRHKLPQRIFINHHRAHFTIELNAISDEPTTP